MPLVASEWRPDPDEWYRRSDAVMAPAYCIDQANQVYQFYVWVNAMKLMRAISSTRCFVGCGSYGSGEFDGQEFLVSALVVVQGERAWESISAELDEAMLGDMWGEAIAEALRVGEASYEDKQDE